MKLCRRVVRKKAAATTQTQTQTKICVQRESERRASQKEKVIITRFTATNREIPKFNFDALTNTLDTLWRAQCK